MAQRTRVEAPTRSRGLPRWATRVAVVGVLDLALVTALLLLDHVQVQSQRALDRVELGMPLSWVTQAQNVTPPLPWRTRLLSPWDNSTSVAWLPLLLNLIVCGALLVAAWATLRATRRAPVVTGGERPGPLPRRSS